MGGVRKERAAPVGAAGALAGTATGDKALSQDSGAARRELVTEVQTKESCATTTWDVDDSGAVSDDLLQRGSSSESLDCDTGSTPHFQGGRASFSSQVSRGGAQGSSANREHILRRAPMRASTCSSLDGEDLQRLVAETMSSNSGSPSESFTESCDYNVDSPGDRDRVAFSPGFVNGCARGAPGGPEGDAGGLARRRSGGDRDGCDAAAALVALEEKKNDCYRRSTKQNYQLMQDFGGTCAISATLGKESHIRWGRWVPR